MERLLIVRHMEEDPEGYLGEILQEKGLAFDIVHAEKELWPSLDRYRAIIALGGAQHVYEEEKNPTFGPEKAVLREVVKRDIPYLGICLGGQLLASALGAEVKRHSMVEFGFFDIPLTQEGAADPLYAGFGGYHTAFHWHEDVFALPKGSVLLANNTNAPNQAFRYGKRAYGVQYHIELTEEMLHQWLHHPDWKEEDPSREEVEAVEQQSRQAFERYRAHARLLLENFLRISELR